MSAEQFADAFGFRGVQFGNYVEGGRRQGDLNEAYDALMDLAGVIGVPARALSLNGELGLAFGARGTGGKNAALAHYGQVVINLTKARARARSRMNGGMAWTTFAAARRSPASESGRETAGIRPAMAEAFGALKQTIGLIGMRERASKLDERRTKDYWTTGREMSARAFESYVIAKLADQGAANDYLANVVTEQAFRNEQSYPYPTAAEIAPVRAAFDRFFQTVEQVQGEDGRIALESRGEGGRGVDAGEAQRQADAFMGKLPGASKLRVSVVESVDQIPEGRGRRRWPKAPTTRRATAAHLPGGRQPADGGAPQQVLAHEVVGHFGVEALLGERFRDAGGRAPPSAGAGRRAYPARRRPRASALCDLRGRDGALPGLFHREPRARGAGAHGRAGQAPDFPGSPLRHDPRGCAGWAFPAAEQHRHPADGRGRRSVPAARAAARA